MIKQSKGEKLLQELYDVSINLPCNKETLKELHVELLKEILRLENIQSCYMLNCH